jgi:hypothetical protein
MAIVSPNMGLAIWNAGTDNYNHDQQADNLAKLDFHDHSPGRGVQIPTEGIKDGAVTAAKLAPGANVIQDGSVTPAKFATLPGAKVYNSAVTALPNGVETTLTFDTDRWDNFNVHDTGANTERLVAPITGLYIITISITSNVSPTSGVLRAAIYKGGTTNRLAAAAMSPNAVTHTLTTFARLVAGEYVLARVLNTTGGAVNVSAGTAAAEDLNDFGILWMAP